MSESQANQNNDSSVNNQTSNDSSINETSTNINMNDILQNALKSIMNEGSRGDIVGFPGFDPDHSRVNIDTWCKDIDMRIKRDNLQCFDVIPRVRAALLGRAKIWYEKYGFQHYEWIDLRSSMIHAFSSGSDIVTQLRKSFKFRKFRIYYLY